MSKSLAHVRHKALVHQSYRCYYCALPIGEQDITSFRRQHSVSASQANLLRCTAEHLQPRSEGGCNAAFNIVAAHLWCNQNRHKARKPLDPSKFKNKVHLRMAKGKWWPREILTLLLKAEFGR